MPSASASGARIPFLALTQTKVGVTFITLIADDLINLILDSFITSHNFFSQSGSSIVKFPSTFFFLGVGG